MSDQVCQRTEEQMLTVMLALMLMLIMQTSARGGAEELADALDDSDAYVASTGQLRF